MVTLKGYSDSDFIQGLYRGLTNYEQNVESKLVNSFIFIGLVIK